MYLAAVLGAAFRLVASDLGVAAHTQGAAVVDRALAASLVHRRDVVRMPCVAWVPGRRQ
jgi:hypothetical protein